jgi:hypothetical protein
LTAPFSGIALSGRPIRANDQLNATSYLLS